MYALIGQNSFFISIKLRFVFYCFFAYIKSIAMDELQCTLSVIKHSGEHSRNVESTHLHLMFSAFPSCSQMPVMFYYSVTHS